MRINTNVSAISAQRNLNSIGSSLTKSVQRLSSGLRIAGASDDAAGLTTSEKMRAQVKGLHQAVRNAQDGISMIQTAEGALNETHAILQRMRELAIQGANDTLTGADRGTLASEVTVLKNQVDRIAATTEFNSQKLLDGSKRTAIAGDDTANLINGEAGWCSHLTYANIDVSRAKADTTYTFTAAGTTGVTLTATIGGNTISQSVKVHAMTHSTNSSQTLKFDSLGVSVTLAGFSTTTGAIINIVTDLTAAGSDSIVTAAGLASAAFHIGANASQTLSVSIDNAQTDAVNGLNCFGYGGGFDNLAEAVAAFTSTSSVSNAQGLIESLDDAIADISANRANLGATQNRLEHTVENLSTASENMAASESRIRDADMVQEMVGFTRGNILSQAATSILAQANQLPQGVLSLLR